MARRDKGSSAAVDGSTDRAAEKAIGPVPTGEKAAEDPRASLLSAYLTLATVARELPPGTTASQAEMARLASIPRGTFLHQMFTVLPEHHGFEVIEPRDGRYALSPLGWQLALRASPIPLAAKALEAPGMNDRGLIRIGGFNAAFQYLIPELLRGSSLKSNIEFVEVHPRERLEGLVTTGEIDVAIDWVGQDEAHVAERNPLLTAKRAQGSCDMVAVAGGQTAGDFAANGAITTEKLAKLDRPLILVRPEVPRLSADGNLPPGLPQVICHTLGSAVSLVQQDIGIGILWNLGDLLTPSGLSPVKFAPRLRTPIQVITYWRTDNAEHRKKFENDPLTWLVERCSALNSSARRLIP